MSTWDALLARGTAAPWEIGDAEVRYLFLAPLLAAAASWVDLGCGSGDAAALALGPEGPARVLLVDRDEDALTLAAGAIGPSRAQTLAADLESRSGTDAVRSAVEAMAADGPLVVSCLDVVHQLGDMTELVQLLAGLGDAATVVMSAPDDAAGAVNDPRRASAWSAAAMEELRRTLPADTRQFTQVPVRGSVITERGTAARVTVDPLELDDAPPAVHHLLTFGSRAATLGPAARARVADLADALAAARRRESDLAYLEARVEELEARVD